MTLRTRHPLTLVAAVARNGVIGSAGKMPWCLPGDLAHFRALTMSHPLLMGRTTHQSIGRPLTGRTTTVMSRTAGFAPPGVTVARDLAAALDSADHQADALGASSIMVVGGASIYAGTIEWAETLLITEIEAEPEGDAMFPTINPQQWHRAAVDVPAFQSGDDRGYRFVRWERR